jgi:hypothetical protein
MFEDQHHHSPPAWPVTQTPQRRVRSLAAAGLTVATFVLISGAAPAATAAPAASTAIPVRTTGPPPGGVPGVTVPTIRWSDAGDGYQQAYAAVPYDYAHPRGKTFRLKLVRLPAADPANANTPFARYRRMLRSEQVSRSCRMRPRPLSNALGRSLPSCCLARDGNGALLGRHRRLLRQWAASSRARG